MKTLRHLECNDRCRMLMLVEAHDRARQAFRGQVRRAFRGRRPRVWAPSRPIGGAR